MLYTEHAFKEYACEPAGFHRCFDVHNMIIVSSIFSRSWAVIRNAILLSYHLESRF